MKELFIGMALVFLDVNVGFNSHTFDVLPDFVGYFLMMRGFEALAAESPYFEKSRPLAMGMAVYGTALYAVNALAVTIQGQFLSFCVGVPSLVAGLLLGYWTVSGIRDVERRQNRDLDGEKLQSFWQPMAMIQGITYACGWIPLVGAVGSIAALVMNVCFLTALYRTMNLYDGR